MVHAHITAWLLAIILFFVAVSLQKSGNEKGAKIVKMILRVFYILIFLTGGMLVTMWSMHLLKAAVGIWVIGGMEMVLAKLSKQEKATGAWTQFVIALVVVLYLGLSLPIGFDFF
ncbi:YisL family protein [Bacillus marasmi]|uniref:YisL family protein n=1 Tax=Bacillus marasmi TaxID=1926279 RepID=UPI0011C7B963|nr:YisL family protein [Bacillus marasmi]